MFLGMSWASERRRYIVKSSLIGWDQPIPRLIPESDCTNHHTCVSGQCDELCWNCKPADFRHSIGLSHTKSYHKINLKAIKLDDTMIDDRIVLEFHKRLECLSNFRAIAKIQIQSSNLRNFAKSYAWKSKIPGRPIYVGAIKKQSKIEALLTHQVQSYFNLAAKKS